jgi:hypothetical protein
VVYILDVAAAAAAAVVVVDIDIDAVKIVSQKRCYIGTPNARIV